MSRRDPKPDPQVVALCRKHDFVGDPRDLIRRLCSDLLAEADPGVPTDLDVLASFQNVLRIEERFLDHDANLRWDGSHYLIEVHFGSSPGRQRFSICHELAHTLFPGATERDFLAEYNIGRSAAGPTEEHLCDIGAAELLMPTDAFSQALSAVPNMTDVCDLADAFQASVEAAARRALHLSGLSGAVVVLEPKLKPTEARAIAQARLQPQFPGMRDQTPAPKLRVRYADCTSGLFIPAHKSVSDDCPLAQSLELQSVDYTGTTGLLDGEFRVSARLLPYRRETTTVDRVIALLLR